MDVLGGLAAKMAGVPFVLSERSSAMAYPGTWKDQLRERIGRFAAAIIANSIGGMDYWRSRATNVRLQLIRNGIPMDRIQSVVAGDVKELGLSSQAEIIVFAGRLSPEKNLPTLIAAVEKVLRRRQDAVFLIFGEGPLRGLLEKRTKESAFSRRIRWLGYAPDLWRWIKSARIFVSVSQFEGNPNAVLEAMAIGCPLVVSDIPAHREILDESSARFCGTDEEEVAAAIGEVLADPPSASARAAAARSRAQDWSIEVAARQYLRLYEALASQSKMTR
jgi:glycosyltransferase involved in cell wall biosynthesis